MARLNTANAKPKAGGDTREKANPLRTLGRSSALQSKFRDSASTPPADEEEEGQWMTPTETRTKSKASRTTESRPQGAGRSQKMATTPSTVFEIFSDSDSFSEREDNETPTTRSPLKLANVNTLLVPPAQPSRSRPIRKSATFDHDKENDPVEDIEEQDAPSITRNPSDASGRSPVRRIIRQPPATTNSIRRQFTQYRQPEPRSEDEDSGDNGSDSMDDFIVSDDDEPSFHESSSDETEEEEAPKAPSPPRPRRKLVRGRRPNPEAELMKALQEPSQKEDLRLEPSLPAAFTVPSPTREVKPKRLFQNSLNIPKQTNRESLDDNDPSSQLLQDLQDVTVAGESSSPTPEPEQAVVNTPPSSPSKNRLRSPTKEKIAIPPTPYRESVDAFWSQEATNDWVDQHSPRKLDTLLQEFEESDNEVDTAIMPRQKAAPKEPKTPSKTALKRAEIEQKKAVAASKRQFDDTKAGVAEEFFRVLDDAVSGGQVQKLSEKTGGVQIKWSKTLQTTAGRASWKQERMRTEPLTPGGAPQVYHSSKHHASIELAARIIDSEDRLINTLAHEYCHLANYMISNVHNNPHGTSFKQWGRKCEQALKDHPLYGGRIEVTTKHTYTIDYKYVWTCVECSQNYGRHSKSIDTNKARCGKCRGVLQQIKPKPRNVSPKKKEPLQQKAVVDDMSTFLQGVSLQG